MTILALLMALAISHFARDIRHVRHYGFAVDGMATLGRAIASRFPSQTWLLVLVLVLILLVISSLLLWITSAAPGQIGLLLLALIVLLYTLGPEDLDTEVAVLLSEEKGAGVPLRIETCGGEEDTPAQQVMRAALERWFGVIFWFVVLNIVGALLYRLTCEFVRRDAGDPEAQAVMRHLLALLQWPVAQLMTLALAVSADFDRAWGAWRHWHAEHGWRPFGCGMLLSAAEDVAGDDDARNAIARSMQLAWRMLIAWLVALSILLLAGWII